MAICNGRTTFTKSNLLNSYKGKSSWTDIAYGLLRFLGIIVQNIYCVSSYLILTWIILIPISWIRSDLYTRLENYLYNSLLFIVSSWSLAAGLPVVETGEDYKHLIEPAIKPATQKAPKKQNGIKSVNHKQVGADLDCSTIQSSDNRHPTQGDSSPHFSDSICSPKLDGELNSNDLSKCKLDAPDIVPRTEATKQLSNQTLEEHNYGRQPKTDQGGHLNKNRLELAGTADSPRILLLCNHISTADVPLVMQSFSSLSKQSLLWVLDAQFKPTNFGLVCSSHGDFFIAKNSFSDGSLRDQVLKYPDRNILILFPEGGFWRKRLDGSNRYALRNGLPRTRYVTHPRFGAFKDLIDPSVNVTHIVDATLFYDDIKNPLSILDIALGHRKEPTLVNYKVYKRSEINPTEEWLRNLWLEKDKLLQRYYEDRESVYEQFEGTMRVTRLDWVKLLTVHLFYIIVCYLTVYRLFNATSSTMLRARDLYYSNM